MLRPCVLAELAPELERFEIDVMNWTPDPVCNCAVMLTACPYEPLPRRRRLMSLDQLASAASWRRSS